MPPALVRRHVDTDPPARKPGSKVARRLDHYTGLTSPSRSPQAGLHYVTMAVKRWPVQKYTRSASREHQFRRRSESAFTDPSRATKHGPRNAVNPTEFALADRILFTTPLGHLDLALMDTIDPHPEGQICLRGQRSERRDFRIDRRCVEMAT